MKSLSPAQVRQAVIFSVLGIVGFISLVACAGFFIGFDAIIQQLARIHPSLLLLLLALSLINYFLRALRWFICSKFIGLESKFWETCYTR